MTDELARAGAVELARLIRTRAISPVEAVGAALAAIERLNPAINAFCTVAADRALDAARELEKSVARGESPGVFAGVPVGIKDVTPTAGIRTTWGSPLFSDHVPAEDAEVVTRLKAAAAIVIGKTNTPEFAAGANTVNPVFGATRNPWNTRLSASVPAGLTAARLPVGLQIVGPRFSEPQILSLAKMVGCDHPLGWPPHA